MLSRAVIARCPEIHKSLIILWENVDLMSNLVVLQVTTGPARLAEGSWNLIARAQKPDFVFRRNGRVHLNRWGRQLSRLPAAEVCVSAVVMVVMLDTPCSEVVWRALATHSIRASPCAITFQLNSTHFTLTMLFKWTTLAKELFLYHFCLLFECNITAYITYGMYEHTCTCLLIHVANTRLTLKWNIVGFGKNWGKYCFFFALMYLESELSVLSY
jgi:hypothetical protein